MKNTILAVLFSFLTLVSFSQNIELDKELGKQNAQMVEIEMGIYKNPEQTEYLNKVLQRLVSALDKPLFDYKIQIVPEMSPNAFALPGGHVYITTGMIPILQNEDELACILGHEVIHSNNRHSIQQIKKSILPKLLEVPGNLLGVIDEDLGSFFNKPIETSNELLFASYGRKFETEADDQGVELAVKAGYKPTGMINSLTRLSKSIEVATHTAEKKSYFNDHPYTPDRTKAIAKKMEKMNYQPKKPISSSFLMMFDGVLFGQDPSKGIIAENIFLHPDLNFMLEFPKGWIIDNQPTNIGAYEPNQKAAAFVGLDDNRLSANQAADKFIGNLKKEHKSKLVTSEPYHLNGRDGFMLTFKDRVQSQTIYAYVLWISMGTKLFQLTGVAPIDYKPTLDQIAKTFRELNSDDRANVKIDKMRVIQAKEGETIESLSSRVDNKLNLDLTRTINDKKTGERLKQGELIKVVKEYSYFESK